MNDTPGKQDYVNPPSSERLQASFERQGEAVTVSVEGEMDFYTVEPFKNKLAKVCRAGISNFIFDLNGLRYIDSTGLGFLVAFHHELKGKSGKLICIMPTNRSVQRTIEDNRVGLILKLVKTRDEAIGLSHPDSPPETSPATA